MKRKLIVNNEKRLEEEFYSNYNPSFWECKITLLKNCHDDLDMIKNVVKNNLNHISDDDFKRFVRTEMHFLYFQMIETLFEIIFAYQKKGDKRVWINLSNSDWKKNYDDIKNLSEQSDLFMRKLEVSDSTAIFEIPLLRWIFYFNYNLNLSDSDWEVNLNKIKELLLIFASDFSDRNEYNAYKHALKFYNTPFKSYFGLNGTNNMQVMCDSNDSINFLEEKKDDELSTKDLLVKRAHITTKPFYFEIDFNRCKIFVI